MSKQSIKYEMMYKIDVLKCVNMMMGEPYDNSKKSDKYNGG